MVCQNYVGLATLKNFTRMAKKQGDGLSLRNLWLSSWVLSLSLFGDALLYVILPINADAFGVSMAMVGFLLAVNRIIRIFAYGLILRIGEIVGMRSLCIFAAVTAALSSLGYVVMDHTSGLIGARMLWGLSYAALLLVTLAYATQNKAKTGSRVGISRSVEQVGPLLAMTVGVWLAGIVGPRDVFIYMAIGSMVAIPLAMMLLAEDVPPPPNVDKKHKAAGLTSRPNALDLLIFWMGAGIDGVFTISITLIWANHVSVQAAIVIGGFILAARRLGEMIVAPIVGKISDRFGVRRPLLIGALMTIAGFAAIGFGFLIAGCVAIVLARGALGTLFPAAASSFQSDQALDAMARNQTWRDIGAAVGPLATGFAITIVSPQSLHIGVAVIFALFLVNLLMSKRWQAVPNPA